MQNHHSFFFLSLYFQTIVTRVIGKEQAIKINTNNYKIKNIFFREMCEHFLYTSLVYKTPLYCKMYSKKLGEKKKFILNYTYIRFQYDDVRISGYNISIEFKAKIVSEYLINEHERFIPNELFI